MQALQYLGPNSLAVSELQDPIPRAGEALLEPVYVGICGTDLLIASGGLGRVNPPVVLGHEMVCRVVVDEELPAGELVFINPLISCAECSTCRSGNGHICERLGLYGIDEDGGLASQIAVKRSQIIRLPQGIDPLGAALIEPLSVAFHMFRMAGNQTPPSNKHVLVIGAGPIGILVAMVARIKGHSGIVIVEPNPNRLDLASKLGFDARPRTEDSSAFDLVFEATGVSPGLNLALQAARPKGTILLGGLAHGELPFTSATAVMKELSLVGSRVYQPEDISAAIAAIDSGQIDPSPLVSSVVPLADAIANGFERLRNSRDEMKVLIKVGE